MAKNKFENNAFNDGLGDDEGLADADIQAMARRQFGVSVVVGLALLAVVALIAMRTSNFAPAEVTAHHRIVLPESSPVETAQAGTRRD
jgi:hypothetical protein